MKRIQSISLLLSFVLVSAAWAQDKKNAERPWFDLEHCAMCKNLAAQEGLMDAIKWETHLIDNGMMMVSIVPEKMKAKMAKAREAMHTVAAELQTGKKLEMCGFCNAYGKLMESGVSVEEVPSAIGDITLMTSDDPEVVKQIHEMANRTNKEYKALQARNTDRKSK